VRGLCRDIDTASRGELLEERDFKSLPLQGQNDNDAFITLKAALEIVVRPRKPKAVEMVKWLTQKGVEKVLDAERHKVQKKDTQLALLNDNLTEAQELVRQLEYNNTGLQGEIRAKDQIVQDLIANRHVPRRHPIDNILCCIDKKSDDAERHKVQEHQFYVVRCQRKRLEMHKRYLRNRYPDM